MTHTIKTWKPFFADVRSGKKSFEFRKNDRNYKVGDEIIHREYDPEKKEETGEQCYCTISYLLEGDQFGIPPGYCVFGQHLEAFVSYQRDFEDIHNRILPIYEAKLNWKRGGSITDRIDHVLSQFENTTSTAVLKAKDFIEDVRVQFKALEMIIEGISSDGYNHSQKRVIANHTIVLLRNMVDRINKIEWDYTNGMYDRFDFFRSTSPEKNLLDKYRELKQELEYLKKEVSNKPDEIPF